MPRTQNQNAVIASGASTSQAIRIHPVASLAIQMPASFTGTALAIHGCATKGGTFAAIEDADGNAVSLAAAAGDRISLTGEEYDAVVAWPYIKLVSNQNEAAERTIVVVTSF